MIVKLYETKKKNNVSREKNKYVEKNLYNSMKLRNPYCKMLYTSITNYDAENDVLELFFDEKIVGKWCKEARNDAKLSQVDVSVIANVSSPYLSQIERNCVIPSANTFFAIAMGILLIPNSQKTEESMDDYNSVVQEIVRHIKNITDTNDMNVISYTRDVLQGIDAHFCSANAKNHMVSSTKNSKNNSSSQQPMKSWEAVEGGIIQN